MSTFKVGEVVVGRNIVLQPEYNGMECQVVGGLEMRRSRIVVTGERRHELAYVVRWSNGELSVQPPHTLRKKRPPTTGEESIIAMFRKDKQPEGEIA